MPRTNGERGLMTKGEVDGRDLRQFFDRFSDNQEMNLDEAWLTRAVETHVKIRGTLDRLRDIELEYTYPIEPFHVLQWIETGGVVASRLHGGTRGTAETAEVEEPDRDA